MNRITLGMLIVSTGAAVALGAQTPPTPPTLPARPARPAASVAPRVRPGAVDDEFYHMRALDAERMAHDISGDWSRIDHERLRENAMRAADMARDVDRGVIENVREQARMVAEATRERVRDNADLIREQARMAADIAGNFAPLADLAPLASMPAMARIDIGRIGGLSDGLRLTRPVFQGEPEDSLYRIAHRLLADGDYGRAASMFKDITQKYPKSVYLNDLTYYEAYARYKIGTNDELQTAAKLLEPRASKLVGYAGKTSNGSYNSGGRRPTPDGDVAALYTRINSVLATRGNRAAADVVAKFAQAGGTICDREEMQVKVEAMNSLSQMDPAQALPIVRAVLGNKDECTVELRRRAVFILGRRGDAEAATLLGATAKSDPSTAVRREAISWLPKLQGDAGVTMLEDLLRTEQDPQIQSAVVRTLVSSDNARARTSMRTLIDRKDAPLTLRIEAINSFNSERATSEDVTYLRALYGRADNDRIKDAVINAIGRIGGQENDQWMLALAKNQNEPSQLRSAAISRLMRGNMPIADAIKLYDASESYEIRSRLVGLLERRSETEAADKLIDIVRNSTVVNLRTQALNALGRRKDPRAVQLYLEILNGKKS